MKKFATELMGMTVMSHKGEFLGALDNYVLDTNTGDLIHILVTPADGLDISRYRTDAANRLVVPFKSIVSIKNVVVVRTKVPKK